MFNVWHLLIGNDVCGIVWQVRLRLEDIDGHLASRICSLVDRLGYSILPISILVFSLAG